MLPVSFSLFFCSFCQLFLCLSVRCLLDLIYIKDEEFGCSKQNNLLSVFIISGISGAGQSAERMQTR